LCKLPKHSQGNLGVKFAVYESIHWNSLDNKEEHSPSPNEEKHLWFE